MSGLTACENIPEFYYEGGLHFEDDGLPAMEHRDKGKEA
jgi:hypothetical protein